MSCPCDPHHCLVRTPIAAGLARIPRAAGRFPDWRRGLLAEVGRQSRLDDWRAREPGDLGLMLVEMAAYVLDVASFYDELIANESYLGTARLAGAQRRHVSLLGYRPRPALASSVWLAAEADGARLVQLPAGTAIRSSAFDGNPPQVFETAAASAIEPRVNRLEVQRVVASSLPSPMAGVPALASSVRVRAGDLVVLDAPGGLRPTRIAGVSATPVRTRQPVSWLGFTSAFVPPAGSSYHNARLLKAGATCGAWTGTPGAGEPAALSGDQLALNARVNLHAGDVVAISSNTEVVARRIVAVAEVYYTVLAAQTSTVSDAANKVVGSLQSPPVKVSVTRLSFDSALPFAAGAVAQLTVHHTMVDAAVLHAPLKDTLAQGDPMALPGLHDAPRSPVTALLLQDAHGDGVETSGAVDAATHSATGALSPPWGKVLAAPVQLFGNVVQATRGESVHGERIGTGDAALALQVFKLAKTPLTYLPAANAAGRRSTLRIHVGGVLWQEVDSFYGVGQDETVYLVRHDDAGNTELQFGGGARLPSGAAVLADYRFGAGAACPPADAVKQLARPVPGVHKVRNVLPAFGGADAEGAGELAVRAPRSALLLGRAISLADLEAAAGQQAGVRAARAAWRWDAQGLRPAAIVSYIGDAQLAPLLQASLRALAEFDAPVSAQPSIAQPARLDVDIGIDARHDPVQVIAALGQLLFGKVTLPGTGGMLRAEHLGPDGVLFASHLVRAVMETPGVAALKGLSLNGAPLIDTGRRPQAGRWFDFDAGGVWINGQQA